MAEKNARIPAKSKATARTSRGPTAQMTMAEKDGKHDNNGNGGTGLIPAQQVSLPDQKAFFKIPARFGHVPVAEEPLGYDPSRKFEHHYPRVELPFQLVDTVETGVRRRYERDELFPNGLNRLFFGDCLHVMRMLPSECIDLIYIDPPFFSGRNYNIIFGDKNEIRSFSDIWEGGMPGYLIWLNARLYEMKRLLKPTGSIYVHLDWHAVHYVKCELDRLFGADCFLNEIVWHYRSFHGNVKRYFARKHDTILLYTRSQSWKFNRSFSDENEDTIDYTRWKEYLTDGYKILGANMPMQDSRFVRFHKRWVREHGREPGPDDVVYEVVGQAKDTVWDIKPVDPKATERIGYPTQKPEELLETIIRSATDDGDVVADFFAGGGGTLATAQRLRRRWLGCDISRVAVALTADRIARILAPNIGEAKRTTKATKVKKGEGLFAGIVENPTLTTVEDSKKKAVQESIVPLIGYTVEHWGIYEINRLTRLSTEEFRSFVLACYGARKWTGADPNIHGVKGAELLWVTGPKEADVLTASDVKHFAQAVMKSRKPEERQAVMIGWGVDPKSRTYAEQVMALGEQKPIQFIKLRLWPLAGAEFKAHVTRKHDKYRDFFSFILPPDIPRIGVTRLSTLKYRFDVSEARSMNTGGKIVNVQWDFDFRDGIFSATQGYQLCRKEKKGRGESGFEGETTVEYTFDDVSPGSEVAIACRIQDDLGGEGMRVLSLRME